MQGQGQLNHCPACLSWSRFSHNDVIQRSTKMFAQIEKKIDWKIGTIHKSFWYDFICTIIPAVSKQKTATMKQQQLNSTQNDYYYYHYLHL